MKKFFFSLFAVIINIFIVTNLSISQIKYAKSDYNIGLQTSLLYFDGEIYSRGYNGGLKDFRNDYLFSKYDGNTFNQLSKSEYNFPSEVIDEFWLGYSVLGVNLAKTNDNGFYSIYNNKVFNYGNKEWKIIFERDSLPKDSIKYITNTICSDKSNSVYFIQSKQKLLYTTAQGTNVSQGIGGTLFKITDNKVSILLDTIYKSDNSSDYLIFNSNMTIDNNNNLLLLGLRKLGIYNLINGELKSYNYEDKDGYLNLFPTSLFVTKENEYIIVFKGANSKNSISIFKDGIWNSLTIDDGYDFTKYFHYLNSPNCIFKSKDNSLWIGSRNGVLRLKDKNVELIIPEDYHLQEYENHVKAITEDKDGNVVIGTINGILIYNLDGTSIEEECLNSINQIFMVSETINLKIINSSLNTNNNLNEFILYDLNGQIIKNEYTIHNTYINITNNLNTGTYYYNYKINNNIYNGKFSIIN